jgi:predicted 3-demethylubiquinone-9 3-methyltransferase (glyoxalase superfamily)
MSKITPFLWFDTQAEEAALFYTSIFKNSKIVTMSRYSDMGPGPAGSVMVVAFELDGQPFLALNGGPLFKPSESVSFLVNCDTQAEIDHFWSGLSDGGEPGQCGWLRDKYGFSWQVVPPSLGAMLTDPDGEKSKRVMGAMLQMKKIEIAALESAYAG